MGRVIAIANRKGGVGKTTTVANLAAALLRRRRRVLAVDLDPQESLAAALGAPAPPGGRTLAEVLAGDGALELAQVLQELPSGLVLAPAGSALANAERQLGSEPGGEAVLRRALEPQRRRFDVVLLDCPPALGLLTLNGLVAADEVLVPAQTEFLALRRLGATLDTIAKVRARLNPKLRLAGILPTLFDARTVHAREVLERMRSTFTGERVFDPIPRSVRFAEAAVAGQSILDYAGELEGAKAYERLARELDR